MTVPHDGGAYAMDSPVLTEELLDVIFPSTSTTPSRWSTLSLFASTSVINAAADRHRRALKSDNRAPIVIMLPGIVGKSDNPYITRLSIRFMMNGE